ncbi:hypothetical protein IKP85_05295 [bacterium]|nr:hypothetical protein [bacterium]
MNDTVYDLSEISKVQRKISFCIGISFSLIHGLWAMIARIPEELGLNFITSVFAFIGVLIIYLILGLIISSILFQPSILAYEKNLDNKEQIFQTNKVFWWTIIYPLFLYIEVLFAKKKNSIIDD